jgi:hypothetical protein
MVGKEGRKNKVEGGRKGEGEGEEKGKGCK